LPRLAHPARALLLWAQYEVAQDLFDHRPLDVSAGVRAAHVAEALQWQQGAG